MPAKSVLPKAFWAMINKTDTCWLWTGHVNKPGGYGRIKANGKYIRVHRYSWELHFGPIPEGKQVLHLCEGGGNPRCVNPDHLMLGDHHLNMAHKVESGRQARGERIKRGKLTADLVRELRQSTLTSRAAAALYGIGHSTVVTARNRGTWKHIE